MTSLSLFSGIGGLDLAAEWAGFHAVAFCERDKFCQQVLKKHWPEVPIYDDVTTLNGSDFRGIDIVHGGFPCQPYSQAGKRLGKDDDRALWPEMLRIIREARPAWVVGENVAGFVTLGLDSCLADLENNGYEAQAFLIPACAVNAPHIRKRVFIVAHDVAHPRSGGRDTWGTSAPGQESRAEFACYTGEDVADASKLFSDGCKFHGEYGESGFSKLGNCSCSRNGSEQWSVEPPVGRVANGVPRRVDRLRALGNAVVPQQAYPIFKAIAEVIQGEAN